MGLVFNFIVTQGIELLLSYGHLIVVLIGGMELLLSSMLAVSVCGASGVAAGSLLLIPLACSLFGISNHIAMQVVGVGFK